LARLNFFEFRCALCCFFERSAPFAERGEAVHFGAVCEGTL